MVYRRGSRPGPAFCLACQAVILSAPLEVRARKRVGVDDASQPVVGDDDGARSSGQVERPGSDCRWPQIHLDRKHRDGWREVNAMGKSGEPSKSALSKAGKTLAKNGSTAPAKSKAGKTLGKG